MTDFALVRDALVNAKSYVTQDTGMQEQLDAAIRELDMLANQTSRRDYGAMDPAGITELMIGSRESGRPPTWKECPHCMGSGEVMVDDRRHSEPLLKLPPEDAA